MPAGVAVASFEYDDKKRLSRARTLPIQHFSTLTKKAYALQTLRIPNTWHQYGRQRRNSEYIRTNIEKYHIVQAALGAMADAEGRIKPSQDDLFIRSNSTNFNVRTAPEAVAHNCVARQCEFFEAIETSTIRNDRNPKDPFVKFELFMKKNKRKKIGINACIGEFGGQIMTKSELDAENKSLPHAHLKLKSWFEFDMRIPPKSHVYASDEDRFSLNETKQANRETYCLVPLNMKTRSEWNQMGGLGFRNNGSLMQYITHTEVQEEVNVKAVLTTSRLDYLPRICLILTRKPKEDEPLRCNFKQVITDEDRECHVSVESQFENDFSMSRSCIQLYKQLVFKRFLLDDKSNSTGVCFLFLLLFFLFLFLFFFFFFLTCCLVLLFALLRACVPACLRPCVPACLALLWKHA